VSDERGGRSADAEESLLAVHRERSYVVERGGRQGTDLGVLEIPPDVAPGDIVETHLGERFRLRRLRGPDLFEEMERSGAPMMPRDIGLILGHTGVASGDRVLDAGTGTGVLAVYMARAGAAVHSYESDEGFADIARANARMAGVADGLAITSQDITTAIDELAEGEAFDVLTLDTADAPAVVARAPALLTPGGFCVVYSPFIEGARESVEAARDADLADIRSFETIQRRMDFDERGSRPTPAGVGHTGYLTIARYRGLPPA
jgi:tRNA (adenine57-N1/adenine58-N1)-methyltransferase